MVKISKIRELPPKIKEIKEEKISELSKLEEEVIENPQIVSTSNIQEPTSSSGEISTALKPLDRQREIIEQGATRETFREESQANEKSDRLYNPLRANENRAYTETRQKLVTPAMADTERTLRPRNLLEDPAMRSRSSEAHTPEAETKYYELKEKEQPSRQRRRYPWEADNR